MPAFIEIGKKHTHITYTIHIHILYTHDTYSCYIHIKHTHIAYVYFRYIMFLKKETSKPMEIRSDTKIKTNYFLYIFV